MRLGERARGGGEDVEPDVVRELERAHGVVEAEPDRRVDVLRRRDPFLGDPEAFEDVCGERPRRDEAARVAADDGLLPHAARELLDRGDRRVRGLLGPDDLDEPHEGRRIEPVHRATRSLRLVAEAISAMESSDVFERRSAPGGAAASSRRKTSRLRARSSGTASMTASASRTAEAGSGAVSIRESAPAASASEIVPAFTSRARLLRIEATAFSSAAAETSVRRTRNPDVAATCAMPLPIAPAPTTAIRRVDFFSMVARMVEEPPPLREHPTHPVAMAFLWL